MDCISCGQSNYPKAYYACCHMTCINCEALANCSVDGCQNVSSDSLVAEFLQIIRQSSEEYAKIIHVQIINAISALRNSNVCQTCGNFLNQDGVCCMCMFCPDLPTYSEYRLLNGSLKCPRCSREFKGARCFCGYVNMACIETVKQVVFNTPQDMEVVVNNPCWTCSNCSYEYNMQEYCQMCNSPKENPATAQSLPAAPSTSGWRCSSCFIENPRYRGKCACGWFFSPPEGFPQPVRTQYSASSPDYQSLPSNFSPQCWACRYCTYEYNQGHMQGCLKCQKPRYSRDI